MSYEISRDGFLFSDDQTRLDFRTIHGFLSTSYWSPGIPREMVERAARNSLCFGAYVTGDGPARQVGYARVVTDRATYAYLCDVFVLESHRGRGVSKRLMEAALSHPDLQGLRRICLMTRDAHGLYARYGFGPMPSPDRYMEIHRKNAYARAEPAPH